MVKLLCDRCVQFYSMNESLIVCECVSVSKASSLTQHVSSFAFSFAASGLTFFGAKSDGTVVTFSP